MYKVQCFESLRDEKVKVLKSIRPIPPSAVHAHAFRAQYGRGVIDGNKVSPYIEEEGVDNRSTTETYAALKLYIDNWRWRNVPFYIRTGKRMAAALHAEWIVVYVETPSLLRLPEAERDRDSDRAP